MYNTFDNYLKRATEARRQKINNFTASVLRKTKQINQKATQGAKQLQAKKAHQDDYNYRLRVKFGAAYDPDKVKKQQQELVKAGSNIAVDGDWGPNSIQAWQDYKSKQNKSKIQPKLVKSQNPYKGLTNMEAITKFKTLNKVTAPYYIIDKQNHQLLKMQGDKVLAKADVMHGLNTTSDGFTRLTKNANGRAEYDNRTNLMATGAGVWTIGDNHPYEGGRAYHLRRTINKGEPYYQANDAFGAKNPIETYSRKTLVQEAQAIHPMPKSRYKDFKNGVRCKSFGCINVQPDFLKKLNPQKGDSVYIIPGVKGNYMYIDTKDNHIKTHYSDTSNQKDNYNYGKKFHFNNINYNTSY